ncbi:alpha/beta fold hydrolase [Sulfobacillus harzensis]|uniref:Alpha/beta hydrolase n=1 Tax=Sulfobacillus harzensis TaxID=2729629 RepID=A0A7Y0L2N2_9FIRM|nr:alpha/beta hydrolase [Sulfobacillus harzensis]NMP21958.1 alpha/beta hydrolase [Sulfobacillus harzensis]
MRLALNGSQSLWYDLHGNGEAVILLHSALGDHRQWDPQMEALTRHFRVVRFDARGYGQSADPEEAIDPTDDLITLMNELGLKKAHLVGSSMGGTTALHAALVHPDRVDRLVLLGSGILGFEPENLASDVPETIEQAYVSALESRDIEALIAVAEQIWLQGIHGRPESVPEKARALFETMNQERLRLHPPDGPEYRPGNDVDQLNRLAAPLLIVIGEWDTAYCRQAAATLAERVSHQIVRLPETAHFPNLTQAETVNRLLLEFLSGQGV